MSDDSNGRYNPNRYMRMCTLTICICV